jgi:hypothetical protein
LTALAEGVDGGGADSKQWPKRNFLSILSYIDREKKNAGQSLKNLRITLA